MVTGKTGIYRVHLQLPIVSSLGNAVVFMLDGVPIESTTTYLPNNSTPYYLYMTNLISANAGSIVTFNVIGTITFAPTVNGLNSILSVDVLQVA